MPQLTIPVKTTGNQHTASELNQVVAAHNTNDTKLATVATGATANASDATLLARANHTGTQSADTLTDGTANKVLTAANSTKLAGIAAGATVNDTDINLKARSNHTGTQSADTLTDGTTNKAFLATERTKLTGIATGATANSTDATLLARANHTGTQAQSTVTNLTTDLAAKQATLVSGTNIKTFEGASILGPGNITAPETDLLTLVDPLQFEENLDGLLSIKPEVLAGGGGGSVSTREFLVEGGRVIAWLFVADTVSRPVDGGIPANAITGTADSQSYSTAGSWHLTKGRLGSLSVSTAEATTGIRQGQYLLNGAEGYNFNYVFYHGDAADVATARTFVGLISSISDPVNANPSTYTNCIGLGNDTGETTFSIIHNDAAGTATKVNLGASFPCNTRNTDIYTLSIEAVSTSAALNWSVVRRAASTGAIVAQTSGSIITDAPAENTRLSYGAWRFNGATALPVQLTHMRMVTELYSY